MGKDQEALAASLVAIAEMHDQHQLPNPTATACVRQAITSIFELKAPRSWAPAEKLLFADLPSEIQAVIGHRDLQRVKEMRRLQNELAELKRRQGSADEPAIIEKDFSDEASEKR
jgi:hypothetical protein